MAAPIDAPIAEMKASPANADDARPRPDAPGPKEGDAPVSPLEPDFLYGFWYRALLGATVAKGKLAKAAVLGTALVVGRDRRGAVFAMVDACPHRGMPLSYARFDGERLQCAFHGWQFDARTGQCRFLPGCTVSQRLNVGAIRAGHVPCEERDGYVWVYMPDAQGPSAPSGDAAVQPPSGPPVLPLGSGRYRYFDLSDEVPIGADHMNALLLDPAHGPFVHRRWWTLALALFGSFTEETRTAYEPTPLGFRDATRADVPDRWSRWLAGADVTTAEAEFALPGVRTASIRFGRFWLGSLITVTPVTTTSCRVDQRVAWEVLYWFPFASSILKSLFWLFLRQDIRVLARQAEGLGRIPRLMFVDDCDRPARWYFAIKRAFLAARRSGRAFRHPMEGPVTLTWRNARFDDR